MFVTVGFTRHNAGFSMNLSVQRNILYFIQSFPGYRNYKSRSTSFIITRKINNRYFRDFYS